MPAAVQRFSAEIPWVLVQPTPTSFRVTCEVCGSTGEFNYPKTVVAVARAHRAHQAPQGSFRLGDAVAAVAKPIARAVGMESCTPCEARRRMLNRIGSR